MQLYCDPISESSRAIVVLVGLLNLPVEVKWISIKRGEHRTPELLVANPLGKVPFLLDDGFCISEACAILTFLARKFQVPDAWYPSELKAQSKVDAGLHWQQRTLRYNTDRLLSERVVRAAAAANTPSLIGKANSDMSEAERGVRESLHQLEYVWLAPKPSTNPLSSNGGQVASSSPALEPLLETEQICQSGLPAESKEDSTPMQVGEIVASSINPNQASSAADLSASVHLVIMTPSVDVGTATGVVNQGQSESRKSCGVEPSLIASPPAALATASTTPVVPTHVSAATSKSSSFSFMSGFNSPCLSDLLCACIVEQLRLLDTVQEKPDFADVLSKFPRVKSWMDSVEKECKPHFADVHASLRSSVTRAHVVVVQQREAAAASSVQPAPAPVTIANNKSSGDLVAGLTTARSSGLGPTAIPATVRPAGSLASQPVQMTASQGSSATSATNIKGPISFTPSFPVFPSVPRPSPTPAVALKAIFDGQPPAAAASTAKRGETQVPRPGSNLSLANKG